MPASTRNNSKLPSKPATPKPPVKPTGKSSTGKASTGKASTGAVTTVLEPLTAAELAQHAEFEKRRKANLQAQQAQHAKGTLLQVSFPAPIIFLSDVRQKAKEALEQEEESILTPGTRANSKKRTQADADDDDLIASTLIADDFPVAPEDSDEEDQQPS